MRFWTLRDDPCRSFVGTAAACPYSVPRSPLLTLLLYPWLSSWTEACRLRPGRLGGLGRDVTDEHGEPVHDSASSSARPAQPRSLDSAGPSSASEATHAGRCSDGSSVGQTRALRTLADYISGGPLTCRPSSETMHSRRDSRCAATWILAESLMHS
jgi:hypothetical protein